MGVVEDIRHISTYEYSCAALLFLRDVRWASGRLGVQAARSSNSTTRAKVIGRYCRGAEKASGTCLCPLVMG